MVIYGLLWMMAWAAWMTPLQAGYAAFGAFGRFLFDRMPRLRQTTLFNLGLAFPEADAGELERIGREATAHTAKTAFEMLKFFHSSPATVARHVDNLGAEDIFAFEGKPAIFAASHTGSWELLPSYVYVKGLRIAAVASRVRQRGVNRFLEEARTRKGTKIIYRDPGVMSSLRTALAANEQVGLVADQHSGDRGIMVTFLDNPAWAFKGPAQLALDTGLPVLPFFSYRRQDNRIVLTGGTPIPLPPPEDPNPIYTMIQDFHDQLSDFVRAHPESYFWVHRKFKGTVVGG